LVDELGPGRVRLYRARLEHPLAGSLGALFAAEEERFAALLAAVRDAAAADYGKHRCHNLGRASTISDEAPLLSAGDELKRL
jgi:hypothetical protein